MSGRWTPLLDVDFAPFLLEWVSCFLIIWLGQRIGRGGAKVGEVVLRVSFCSRRPVFLLSFLL